MSEGPDFQKPVKEALAKRAAQKCSNPGCRKPTSGPHSDPSRAVNRGEAAHIRGARPGSARYDPAMTDEQRADPSNGIWLCVGCAALIDRDAAEFPVETLQRWKADLEAWVAEGCPSPKEPMREVTVKNGGVGAVLINEGPGTAMRIVAPRGQPGERIRVEGRGVGEIVLNTGPGTAKVVGSSDSTASESSVAVTQPVQVAVGLHSNLAIIVCTCCGFQFEVSKVAHAFAGGREPQVSVTCPSCGAIRWV